MVSKVDPAVTKEKMRQVVRYCDRYQSIDPAPSMHESGEIGVDKNWNRLAVDVTYYQHGL